MDGKLLAIIIDVLYLSLTLIGFIIFFRNKSHIIKVDNKIFDKNELLNYKKIISSDPRVSFYRKLCILCVILYFVFTAVAIYIIFSKGMILWGFILLGLGFISAGEYGHCRKIYTSVYRNNVISRIIKDRTLDLEFFPDKGVTKKEYFSGNLGVGGNIDFKSSCLIIGNIDNYKFKLSNVSIVYNDKDDDHGLYFPLFEGAFSLIHMNKSINSYIHVSDNTLLGNYNKISIDNEAFEKVYDVFSDNEILAMRILTPNITNEILNLRNKYHVHCEIKIDNDYIYFRFFVKELFGPFVFNKNKEALNIALSFKVIEGMQNIMGYLIKVIEEVDV